MRTTSGAHVFVRGDRAYKVGTGAVAERLRAQARYCKLLGTDVCPEIYGQWFCGYAMECLDPFPRSTDFIYVSVAAGILRQYVWSQLPKTYLLPHWQEHFDYILHRVDEYCPYLMDRAVNAIDAVNTDALTTCLTHGDPTFENMMSKGGRPIIIDPLPPTSYMPEVRAVDLGKIIQSLLGYEDLKYPGHRLVSMSGFKGRLERLQDIAECGPIEWQAALWFAFAHCIRLLPYQPREHLWKFQQLASGALMHNTWSSCM